MPNIALNPVVDSRRWAALSRSFADQPRWLAGVLRLRRMHLAALPCVALGLVACGGDDRSAAVDGATGAAVTTERVTSVQRNNATPTGSEVWVACASEWEVCKVADTRLVRYGANGQYVFKTVSGSISCTNDVWGDPIVGVVKRCEQSSSAAAPPPVAAVPPAPAPAPAPQPPAVSPPVSTPDSAPANYAANLAMIKKASTRNALLDGSRFRDVPMAQIPKEQLFGPRSDYLKTEPSRVPGFPDEISEPGYPAQNVGTFRTSCEFSHFAYDDPLVHPGKPGAAHLHMFWGNTDVNAFSTYDSLLNSGSSTCNGMELNRTGYWAPAMFDAKGNVRVPERIVVYYKGYGLANGASQVYPPRAAMVIDDRVHRTSNNAGSAVGEMNFMCSDQYRGDRSPAALTIPNCDGARWQKLYGNSGARSTLEMHVKFANCWNRQDPSQPSNWVLPRRGGWFYSDCQENATTPNIHYIIVYGLDRNENTDGWYLSSDVDPTTRQRKANPGASVHADWWGAWNPEVNKMWIDNCVNFKSSQEHGCGFGYLSDGGPSNANPYPGPALKLRQKYRGNFKVAATTLYEELCPGGLAGANTLQTAYCNPSEMRMAAALGGSMCLADQPPPVATPIPRVDTRVEGVPRTAALGALATNDVLTLQQR
jgi:hypothetical protein